jgi:hypothetical protein
MFERELERKRGIERGYHRNRIRGPWPKRFILAYI